MTENFTAFEGPQRLVSGPIAEVALAIKGATRPASNPVAIFSDSTGRPIDLDLRGSNAEVLARLSALSPAAQDEAVANEPRGRGRPKLGVVARGAVAIPVAAGFARFLDQLA